MGNCLKKNKVEPFDPKNKTGSGKRPNSGEQAEMIRNLKDEGAEARVAGDGLSFVVDFTESKKGKKPSLDRTKAGAEARVAGDGLSFVVDFTESKKRKKPSLDRTKAGDRREAHADENLPTYSVEERVLMADILREDQLREKAEKARSVDMKIYDAKRRRLLRDAEAEAMRKQNI